MPTVAEEAAAASPEKGSPVRTCHQLRGVLTRPIKEPLPGTFYPAVFGVFQSQPGCPVCPARLCVRAWEAKCYPQCPLHG